MGAELSIGDGMRQDAMPDPASALVLIVFIMNVIPTAVKRARVFISVRVGRRDLAFGSFRLLQSKRPAPDSSTPKNQDLADSIPGLNRRSSAPISGCSWRFSTSADLIGWLRHPPGLLCLLLQTKALVRFNPWVSLPSPLRDAWETLG